MTDKLQATGSNLEILILYVTTNYEQYFLMTDSTTDLECKVYYLKSRHFVFKL